MQIDTQTFNDLEIFAGREGRPGLFNLLDRARTREGAAALRRRFLRPESSAAGISAVQQSLKHILAHRELFRAFPGQYAVSGFHNYFHWHLAAPASANPVGLVLDALFLVAGHYRERQRLAVGVHETARIVRYLRDLAAREELRTAPGVLGALLVEVRELVGSTRLSRMRLENEARWGLWRLLRADRVFRHDVKDGVSRLIQILFELDALISMADATREYGFTFPQLVPDQTSIRADGVYHPFLEAPVRNSLEVGETHRLLFLTGPNMAGKTTYLRSCGIAVFLAHVGMGVPARGFAFAPADTLITAISLSDDVRAGISFFQAEALRARLIAEAVADGRRVIAILDEPFKGTNVKDALDASVAFLSRLAVCDGSLFVVASHLIEAGELLAKDGLAACRRFEAREADGTLRFDYTLREGVSDQRLGMRVLTDHGVFELLDSAIASRTDTVAAHTTAGGAT